MSSKIVVTEGNDVKIINDVSKLVTRLSNGETCNWVQEDSVRLVTKTIIKDGIYIANNDVGSPYGYSQVSVNGVGNKILGQLGEKSITKNGTYEADKDKDGPYYGYSTIVVNVEGGESGDGGGTSRPVVPGKDKDGDDAVGTIDDDGNIVVEKLPVEIRVITTPDNLEYEDGQSIVFDGLLVKAYYPDGTEYDSIPTTDLIRPVRVAEFDESTTTSEHRGRHVYSAGTELGTIGNRTFIKTYDGDAWFGWFLINDGYLNPVLVSSTAEGATFTSSDPIIGGVLRPNITGEINGQVYYGNAQHGLRNPNPSQEPLASGLSHRDAILYLWTESSSESGSQQTIPLQWERPGDKKVLETSFTITVYASDDSGSGSGGSSSDPQPQPTPQPS